MVKFYSKRFLALVVASVMVVGSSATAFAADPSPETSDGTGSYEGNDIVYSAPTITLPTIEAGTYNYYSDPNGLIRQSAASKYANSVWSDTAKGVFFKTESKDGKDYYTENSAPYKIEVKSAYGLNVTANVKQKTAGTNVTFNDDPTFKDSTTKQVYIAVSDGTNTAAIKNDTAATGASIKFFVPGKPSNYELIYDSTGSTYKYQLKGGKTEADFTWNSKTAFITGALNTGAEWTDATAVPPALTVTWNVKIGAAPIKIVADQPASGTLTYKAGTTVSEIYVGATKLPANMYTVTTPTTEAAAVLTLPASTTSVAYAGAGGDGLQLTVKYADGAEEVVTLVKKY